MLNQRQEYEDLFFFLRVFCSPTFINLTLASTGFSLRPQIQRGKIGWMPAKTVGSKRGRRQSPAHSEKISNVIVSVRISYRTKFLLFELRVLGLS